MGFAVGLTLALSLTLIAGESPLHVLSVLVQSSFGTRYNLGMTLFYATPLIFTGLAVAISSHAGLFNVGAEGQLTIGSLAAAIVGVVLPNLAFPWGVGLAILVALVAGGIWGFIPSWLRVVRGSHEVITTIMLNFVAAGLAGYVVLHVFPSRTTQNSETEMMGTGYLFHDLDLFASFFQGTPASSAFLLAIATCALLWLFLWRTTLGFEVRAVGANAEAAEIAGIPVKLRMMQAMTLAGALAALVVVPEILGSAGNFRLGFSPDYGFTGIAVALLARNSPLGIIVTGLLFGALHNGTSSLDLETDHITRDFAMILQGLIILFVAVERWPAIWRRK